MKPSIATLVAVVATLGMLGWMRQGNVTERTHESSCTDDARPMTAAKPVAPIGICHN
jgi:hypothetical protein